MKYFIENTKTGEWLGIDWDEVFKPLPNNSELWTNDPLQAYAFETFDKAEQHRQTFGYHFDYFKVTEHEFVPPSTNL